MRMYVRMARATRRASILYPGAVTGTRPGSHGSRVAGRRFWPGSRVAGRRSATPCDPANPAFPHLFVSLLIRPSSRNGLPLAFTLPPVVGANRAVPPGTAPG